MPAVPAEDKPERVAAREAAATQRESAEAADQALAARSGSYLADWPIIANVEEASLVWEMLTAVLRTAPDPVGVRTAFTEDDRWKVVAYPAPLDRPAAVLAFPEGHLACANWKIEVTRA